MKPKCCKLEDGNVNISIRVLAISQPAIYQLVPPIYHPSPRLIFWVMMLAGANIYLTHANSWRIFILMKPPKTLQEAIIYFSDPDRAFDYAKKLRWPDGKVVCPRCGSEKNYFIKTRKLWLCRGCNKQFTLKVNTIFEDSPLGLDKWMAGFWMLVNCKNGVSSMEIHRTLGITQKSAWLMLQRLRTALDNRAPGSAKKFGGPEAEVGVDKRFVG